MTKNPNVSAHSATLTLAAVEAMLPAVREAAAETSNARRLPQHLVEALRASGLMRMYLPKALGGFEARPVELVRAIATLATADGSTAWCAAIAAGGAYFGGLLPRAGAEVVFANPDASVAAVFEPRGSVESDAQGLRLSGRWAFASNCQHSDFVGFAALFPTLGEGPRIAFVPQASVRIHDTWHVAGLRGTGSHDCSLERVSVEPELTCSLGEQSWVDSPLFRLPTMTALGPVMAAVPLGMARGVVDDLLLRLARATPENRGFAEDEQSLAELAVCDAAVRAAEALLVSLSEEAWSVVERDATPTALLRAQVFMACQHVLDTAVSVASTAHRLAGSAAVYDGNRYLRVLQDVHTARQHAYFARRHRPSIARALAGLKGSSRAPL